MKNGTTVLLKIKTDCNGQLIHENGKGVQQVYITECILIFRSSHYGWRRQPQSKRQKENEKILMEIKESHKNSRKWEGGHGKGVRS